jgi:predicted AAA+ superfamily ATPase
LTFNRSEALQRANWSRRRRWHLDYIDALIQRDVRDIAQVSRLGQLARLLRVLAEHSGQLINYSALGAALGMNHVTCQKYIGVFEQLYLIQPLDPWFSNRISRLIKTPKLHFLDSGLLAAVRNLSPDRIRAERTLFGPLLETFVLAEVIKLISSSDENYQLFHFRDKERNEVDIVIEDDQGRVVGIEVKAAATVTAADFNGLRKLAGAAGENFAAGLVLYDHDQTLSFGERLWAVPVSSLWAGKPQTDRASTEVPAKLMQQRDSRD